MGMFDYFKCSKDIGELTNVECQTKDIDYDSGTFSFYWVDPAGMLWYPDYQGTTAFKFLEGDDIPIWKRMKYVPTGSNGRMLRVYLTNYTTIYNAETGPDGIVDLTYCKLHFVDGILQDYKYINTFT